MKTLNGFAKFDLASKSSSSPSFVNASYRDAVSYLRWKIQCNVALDTPKGERWLRNDAHKSAPKDSRVVSFVLIILFRSH